MVNEPCEVKAPRIPPICPDMYKPDQAVKPAYNTPAASMSSIVSGLCEIYKMFGIVGQNV